MDFETSGGIFDEDVATQYMIEQSILPSNKTEFKDIFSEDGCDVAALRKLTTHQYAFSEEDNMGNIPLHEAAKQNNQYILEITYTASPADAKLKKTLRGKTALFLAVEEGLLDNACYLLDNGSSPDCLDGEEDTPLFVAIRNNHYDMVKLLLSFNVKVNQEGAHCRTALHEAARMGLTDTVNLLLQSGAQPDPRSNYGLTPLALAAQGGHLEIVQALLRKGQTLGDKIFILLHIQLFAFGSCIWKFIKQMYIFIFLFVRALALLIPVTTQDAVDESGMSPLHSAAAGGHTHCLRMLLRAGYDPNFMLDPWVQRSYDDRRKSALYFAVSNDDVPSSRALLEAGAMPNQDPVKCLQVALRLGNYELIDTLLRHGANVNYFCRVNTTRFPSALQYALKDEVVMRMLFNYGYDVQLCFHCPYGDKSHVPDDYEGWSNTVIKDTAFCEVITVSWLKHLAGHVVRVMLDYVDHVRFCSKLKATLMEQTQWTEICRIQENVRCLQHLCRLKIRRCMGRLRLRAPVFMSFLSLPHRLKEFILYREYDLYRQKCQGQSK
uniref:SOCS box domain-containing protein n=1 Tax=Electrophorus electricus TaxID=8005 RepID=A0A4W4FAJ7_ELEEL